jgi:hypothetical protein
MNNQTLSNKQQAILAILNTYNNISIEQITDLIETTNGIGGVSFVKLRGYSSDKSNNTEVADQLINVGASYSNMLVKDENIFGNFDLSNVDINKFNYDSIDLNGVSVENFKKQVFEMLPIALAELNKPTEKKETNDIWLNKALVFNLTTLRLSIFGQSINKQIEVKGEYKLTKSKPKTIAKELIKKAAGGKKSTLRRFAIDNFNGSIKVKGDTIEIN